MEALKSWGITICLAALAAGIAGIIAPSGKMEKVYKFAVSLFFLCCLLVPIFSLKNISLGSITLNQANSVSNRDLSSAVSEQEASIAQQNIAQLVTNCCHTCNVKPMTVNVKVSATGTSSAISVESAEVVLKASDMSKQSKITDTVKSQLGIIVKIKEGGK
jgi:stage III sporulation protein AF